MKTIFMRRSSPRSSTSELALEHMGVSPHRLPVPFPPRERRDLGLGLRVEAELQDSGRAARDDGEWRNVPRDDGVVCQYRAIPDFDTGHHVDERADPYVVPDLDGALGLDLLADRQAKDVPAHVVRREPFVI